MGSSRGLTPKCLGCGTIQASFSALAWGNWLCYHCNCKQTKRRKHYRPKQVTKKVGSAQKYRANRIRGIMARDGEGCTFCGCQERLTIDHIKPRIQGGTDRLDNLRLLCRPCHDQRHQKDARVSLAT